MEWTRPAASTPASSSPRPSTAATLRARVPEALGEQLGDARVVLGLGQRAEEVPGQAEVLGAASPR